MGVSVDMRENMKSELIWFWILAFAIVAVNGFFLIRHHHISPGIPITFTSVPLDTVLVLPNKEGDAPIPITSRYDVLGVRVRTDLLNLREINQGVANYAVVALVLLGLLVTKMAKRQKK